MTQTATQHAPWSAEQDRQLLALRNKQWTTEEIGEFMDRSPLAIKSRLGKLAMKGVDVPNMAGKIYRPHKSSAQPATPRTNWRKCMRCGKPFRSAGPHNRLCGCQKNVFVSPYEL